MHRRDRQRLTDLIRWHPCVSTKDLHRQWNAANPECQVSIETVRRIRRPFHSDALSSERYEPTAEQIKFAREEIQQTWSIENEQRHRGGGRKPYEVPCVSAHRVDGLPIFVPAEQTRCEEREDGE